jgi:GT2 family glycosyltransferase
MGNLQEAINQKAIHISHLEGMVSEKDREMGNLQEAINQKAIHISHLEGMVSEKDREMGNLQEAINQKAIHISHLEGMVSEKEAEGERLRASLSEKVREIASLTETVSQREAHVTHLESAVTAKEAILNYIYNSHGWKALLIYYGLRDKIFPANTKRRLFSKIIFKMVTNPRGILTNLSKRNLKTFGYYFWTAEPAVTEEKIEKKISATSVGGESSAASEPPAIKMEFEEAINERRIEDLYFPYYDQPLVSIIIPVFNQWQHTFDCMDSILKNTNEVPYEVIVVNNGSSDETPLMLKEVKNIRIINNSTNIGFVDACNMGANACNGKYVLMLNNDTRVTKGWLKSMIELAEKDKLIGLVGAKLIYPDGKLQEAGGIVWNDPINLAWNYGRYNDPNKWEYSYVKEVDYCSAACLLVKKELFERIGLFDRRFTPGYCEDVDLAFSIRKLGYKVMYQPKSEVVHFEGITGGVNISEGYKSYQVINQKKFYEKWKDTLEAEHFENGQNVFLARDRSKKKEVILVVDHYVPTYDKDAGSLRMFNILKILSELGHKVTFIGDNLMRLEPYTQELQQEGVEVIYVPYVVSVKDYIHEFGRYFSVVILSRSHIAIKHIDMVKSSCPKARIIYDTVDLGFLRESRRAKIENNEKLLEEAERLKSTDLYLSRNSDLTLVVSQVEKSLLLKENPLLNVGIVSIIQRVAKPQKSFSERKGILFVGGFDHLPNIDAVIFFVKEIFPVIKQRLPDLTFCIAGSNPPDQVLALKSSHVIVTGYVRDLTPYVESSKVFVAPLRYGAGVKGKINHSMSHGLPVVTTSIGAEGIELTDGVDVLIADEPEEFAEKVVRLYTDENLWNKLSENSMKNIEKYFSYDVAKHKLRGLLEGNRNKSEGNHA